MVGNQLRECLYCSFIFKSPIGWCLDCCPNCVSRLDSSDQAKLNANLNNGGSYTRSLDAEVKVKYYDYTTGAPYRVWENE